jgi:2-amino-4-hydroxy-6-hydroxymethyldihydropteridine diphosphokinase
MLKWCLPGTGTSSMTCERVTFVAIGSNSEEREQAVLMAVSELDLLARKLSVSRVYETTPMGPKQQPPYLNCVARLEWRSSPRSLLHVLQQVETRLGRRRTVRWGMRVIDLDLLLFSDLILNDHSLELPHPSMHTRVFVLRPLLELAPNVRSPRTGVPYRRYLRRMPPTGWRVLSTLQRTCRDTWVLKAA